MNILQHAVKWAIWRLDRRQGAPDFHHLSPYLSLIVTPRLLQCLMSLGAFLIAHYHATPVSQLLAATATGLLLELRRFSHSKPVSLFG